VFNSRNILSFYVPPPLGTRNYVINSPICRLPESCNEVINFDFNFDSVYKYIKDTLQFQSRKTPVPFKNAVLPKLGWDAPYHNVWILPDASNRTGVSYLHILFAQCPLTHVHVIFLMTVFTRNLTLRLSCIHI